MSRLGAIGVTLGVAGAPADAWAFQGGEDASTLPVLIDKQNGLANKLQISLMFSSTLATKYVDSIGGNLLIQYNFNDLFGIELMGGFYGVSESQILEIIRGNLAFNQENRQPVDPALSDMDGIQWLAGLNLVLVPIYGKISFAAEYNPSFDIYILAGGGVVGTERGEIGDNPQPVANLTAESPLAAADSSTSIALQLNIGIGLRIFLIEDFAFRLDVRNYFFPDPQDGEVFVDTGATTPQPTIEGWSLALVGQAGFQYNFDLGGGQ